MSSAAKPTPTEPSSTAMRARTISVIVPSWRRPADLERCLRALAAQARPPLEVVVGARARDDDTVRIADAVRAATGLTVRVATTPEPGVIAAMAMALGECRGDIVALTDDDAEPRADWLQRLDACFDDPTVGGAGGRDWQPKERGDRSDVGRVQWVGRVIGNHHLGSGPARAVDVLKGVNLAMRAPLLAAAGFDARLRGAGAQMFWELALCLPARRAGWTLVYDPAIAVDHHIAVRHDADQRHRGVFAPQAQSDAVHNETLVMLEHLSAVRRVAFLLWALLIGTRIEPGLLQAMRLTLSGDSDVVGKLAATLSGRLAGFNAWVREGRDASLGLPRPPRP
jgi:GT2 family glycosyltransferase